LRRRLGGKGDLERAEEVMRDIFRLTGYRVGPQHHADRTLTMLLAHWGAVESLAEALVNEGRIEGEDVQRIIDADRVVSHDMAPCFPTASPRQCRGSGCARNHCSTGLS
jgi:hypothetical protein